MASHVNAAARRRAINALTGIRMRSMTVGVGRGWATPGGGDAGLKSHQVPLAVSIGVMDTLHESGDDLHHLRPQPQRRCHAFNNKPLAPRLAAEIVPATYYGQLR